MSRTHGREWITEMSATKNRTASFYLRGDSLNSNQEKNMPSRIICAWLLCMLLILSAQPSYAAQEDFSDFDEVSLEDLYGDEELVSIATGSSKPIYKAPAVASVITAEQIKIMGARNLDEVLETVPGLHVMPSSLDRLNSTFSIRGINTKFNPQVLMLLNGIPFKKTDNGGRPTLFRLPVASIARVEVIRGPGSAIYGADAYSGVINVITKGTEELEGTELGSRRGSFNSSDLWLTHGSTWKDVNVAFTVEWQKSDGDKDRRINSDAAAANISNAPGPLETRYEVLDSHLEINKEEWTFRLWNWRLFNAGVGAGGALALDPQGSEESNLYLVDLDYLKKQINKAWDFNANLHFKHHKSNSDFVLFPSGHLGLPDGLIGNPSVLRKDLGFDLSTTFTGWHNHRVRLGAGAQYEEVDTSEIKNFGPGVVLGELTDVSNSDNVYLADASRNLWYLSAQDEWKIAPDWELTAGIRFDEYSDFGGTFNPRLALVWAARYNLTAKLLYGRAFRAPAFAELSNKVVYQGNNSLAPETIDTYELVFDYRPTFDLQTNLSIYYYLADGLIDVVSNNASTRDQRAYGTEFEVKWKANNTLDINANIAWVHAEDKETGERVADIPAYQFSIGGNWKFQPQWNLHVQSNYVGGRNRTINDNRADIADYVITDLTLSRTALWQHWQIDLAARNLFDQDAKEPSDGTSIRDDYPLEGRSLWLALSYTF